MLQGYNFFGIRSYNDSDDMRHVAWNRYNLTGNALIINENKMLDTNVKFYRKFGIVARNVIKERILVSLISDYINGRESNRGA